MAATNGLLFSYLVSSRLKDPQARCSCVLFWTSRIAPADGHLKTTIPAQPDSPPEMTGGRVDRNGPQRFWANLPGRLSADDFFFQIHIALQSASTLFGVRCEGREGVAARCSAANLLTLQEPVPGRGCK